MATFSLYFLNGVEKLEVGSYKKDLRPLELCNAFMECIFDSKLPLEAVCKFHTRFYNTDDNLPGIVYALKTLNEYSNDKCFSDINKFATAYEVCLNYENKQLHTEDDRFLYEASAMLFAIKMWLYHGIKGTKCPGERFATMTHLYGYDMSIPICEEILLNTDKEDTLALLACAYFSFYKRNEEVKKQLFSYKGNIARLHISDSLLSLAWSEIECYIEKNIEFGQCVVCKCWFLLPKGKTFRRISKDIKDKKRENTYECGYAITNKKTCSKDCSVEYKKIKDKINVKYRREKDPIMKGKLKKLCDDIIEGKITIKEINKKYDKLI